MSQSDVLTRSERILVVEDDEFSQQLIELYLRKAGFEALTVAADGRQALDLAKENAFDLVLLDLNLPRIGGAEVLRRLKKEGFLTDAPVIIISSIANMEDIVHALDLGAEDYLPKPFNVRLLEGRVSACLEKRRLKAAARGALDRREREAAAARRFKAAASAVVLPPAGRLAACAAVLCAAEPAGDFHTVFPLPDGSTVFALGTVSGQGLAPVLEAGRVQALIRRAVDEAVAEAATSTAATDAVAPHRVLAAVNRALLAAPSAAPASVLLGTVSADAGALRLASAGHADPFLLNPRRGVQALGCERGRALGIQEGAVYVSVDRALDDGDLLVAVTRGLGDAADATGLPFGAHRLAGILDATPTGPEATPTGPEAVATALEVELRRFLGRAAPADDITILALGRTSG